jgi:Uma2 family endonuclease
MVVCAPDGDDEKRANAPCLVVEVRSPSTGTIDLYGHKLHAYQALPSVLAYLVVEQERRAVVHHWRTAPRAAWQREELTEAGRLALPCPAPGGVLTLDEIYEGIPLPSGRPPLRRTREDARAI